MLLGVELSKPLKVRIEGDLLFTSIALCRDQAYIGYCPFHPVKPLFPAFEYALKRLHRERRCHPNSRNESNLLWTIVTNETPTFFIEHFSELLHATCMLERIQPVDVLYPILV